MISEQKAADIAKEFVSKAMTQTRQMIAKMANEMASDMERKGVVVDGPTALRAFAATVDKVEGEQTQ